MKIGAWKPIEAMRKVIRQTDDGEVTISFVSVEVEGATISVGDRRICTLITPDDGVALVLNLEAQPIPALLPEEVRKFMRALRLDGRTKSADEKRREVLEAVRSVLPQMHEVLVARASDDPEEAKVASDVCFLVDNMDEIVRVLNSNSSGEA